jgi:hypothetical protein
VKGEFKLIDAKAQVPEGWAKVPIDNGCTFLRITYPSGEEIHIDLIQQSAGKEETAE